MDLITLAALLVGGAALTLIIGAAAVIVTASWIISGIIRDMRARREVS